MAPRVKFSVSFLDRNQENGAVLRSDSRRGSPEKEERSYTTRGSVSFAGINMEENGKVHQSDGHGVAAGGGGEEHANRNQFSHRGCGAVWPKLYVALSSKEKEEDFLAMKGCKLPQRPKKRAKVIQRTILVSFLSVKIRFLFSSSQPNRLLKLILDFLLLLHSW